GGGPGHPIGPDLEHLLLPVDRGSRGLVVDAGDRAQTEGGLQGFDRLFAELGAGRPPNRRLGLLGADLLGGMRVALDDRMTVVESTLDVVIAERVLEAE